MSEPPVPEESRSHPRPFAPRRPGSSAPRGAIYDLGFLILATLALVVPSWLTAPPAGRPLSGGAAESPRRIHLNRSAWYEWTLLPGIGEARARRIVEFREKRGGFRSIDDLNGVPGMPRGWTERVRPFLMLEDGERDGFGHGHGHGHDVKMGIPGEESLPGNQYDAR